MWVVVHMFLNLESQIICFHLHADIDIKTLSSCSSLVVIFAIYSKLRIIGILYPTGFVFFINIVVNALFNKVLVQICCIEELTSQIYNWSVLALLCIHKHRRNACIASYKGIISTKGRSNMYNTRTIFSGYVVTWNHTESLFCSFVPFAFSIYLDRFHKLQQLFVFHTHQVSTLIFAHYLERNNFIAFLVIFQRHILALLVEVGIEQSLCQHSSNRFPCIAIIALHSHIVNLRPHTESCVWW